MDEGSAATKTPSDLSVSRYHVDLTTREVRHEVAACDDLEDALGGIARGYKLLIDRPVEDPYAPEATLLVNLGLLSGTAVMTGLRTFLLAYSPLKRSREGRCSLMWSTGSGRFGTELRGLGIDDLLVTGRANEPIVLRITPGGDDDPAPVRFEFHPAEDLRGRMLNDRMQELHRRFPQAHFAAIGPAGEHPEAVRFAAVGLSTENQFKSGDPKPRFCGRGGMGGVFGAKNLFAIAAEGPPAAAAPLPADLKTINKEIATGRGSARFRDADRGGGGGTWANCEALQPVHALPEMNFVPTGGDESRTLLRPQVEAGPFTVVDESCYRCGIRCHKNVHDEDAEGRRGAFRAKLDYEPLNLLSSNLGIFDPDAACTLVQRVDEWCLDSISCGVTLAYAMEYNRRHADEGRSIAGGVTFGDVEGALAAIDAIGSGELPLLGQGVLRLSEQTGEPGYAMHSKGVEYPAYLPQTNPGYPFALAGGHMSMRTYLLLLYERETGLDYWVDAIADRGPSMIRDDLTGMCKFAGLRSGPVATAIGAVTGLKVTKDDLARAVRRTHLRGYLNERRRGFTEEDYSMPAEVHREYPQIELPHFNTAEFYAQLRDRVLARFDELAHEEGLSID